MLEQRKVPVSREEFDARWGQGPEADREVFFPEWTVEELMRFYDQRFPEYTKFSSCEPGSKLILERLRTLGKKIAIASNSSTIVVNDLLKHAGLSTYPDLVVGVDQVKQGKPEPDLLLRAAELFKLQRSDVFYIGDSIFDAEAAKAAAIFFVGYKRPGDLSIQSFDELSGLL